MCSRYSHTSPPEATRALFRYAEQPNFPPRANIAPTQPVPIIRLDHAGARTFQLVRWGLIPSWVKDPREFTTLINARSETVFEKPSFRGAIKYRRCLVPSDGFYEWTGERGSKTPHFIHRRDGQLMAYAGVWESWLGADGSEMDSMAILTTGPNATMAPIHTRMPVIVAEQDFETWLTTPSTEQEAIANLLRPAPNDLLEVSPVTWSLSHAKTNNADSEQRTPDRQGSLF
ncbi:MAG: SOS response-associated peptidase [Pseudomonadota bacterium]